jgi:hypothetical protein
MIIFIELVVNILCFLILRAFNLDLLENIDLQMNNGWIANKNNGREVSEIGIK